MKDLDHNSSFLSLPDTETAGSQPWTSAAAAAAAEAAGAAAAHEDFAQDLWRRLVDRIPDPPCSIIDDASSPSPISQDLGGSYGTMSFLQDHQVQQVQDVLKASGASAGDQQILRRQLFAEGQEQVPEYKAASAIGNESVMAPGETPVEHLEDSKEDFQELNGLLRRHGFGEVQHTGDTDTSSGGSILVDTKGLRKICLEVLYAYVDRGRRLQQALLQERSQERQKSDVRVQDLLRQNAKLQEELNATRSSSRRMEMTEFRADTTLGLVASPLRNPSVQQKQTHQHNFRLQKAEALARQRERELEKLKPRLEQALAAVKRKEMEGELRKVGKVVNGHKADAAETTSLKKQVQTLTFRLEETEQKLRQAEAVHARRPVPAAPIILMTPEPEDSAKIENCKKALEAEKEMRSGLEEQVKELQLRHAAEVRSLSSSLNEAEEKAERFQAELRIRQTNVDSQWQREVSKLREDLVQARKVWKSMDSRSLMKRDKELRSLGLDVHAMEESVSKSDLVEIFVELCRLLKTKDISSLTSEVKRLARPEATEMLRLAEGSVEALKELHGKTLSPDEVLCEVMQMCARWKSVSSPIQQHQETQVCMETVEQVELAQLKDANRAQVDILDALQVTMGCSAEDLVTCAESLVKKSQDQTEYRTACKLREDLTEARRAWKAVDTRSLIKRDKELRRLGLDAHAVEKSVTKTDLVEMFLELCRLLKTKDMSALLSEVKSLTRGPSMEMTEMIQLAQGSLQALKELRGQDLSPDQALAEVKEMCSQWKRPTSPQCDLEGTEIARSKGELAIATAQLEKLKELNEAQDQMLEDLASAMQCCKDDLPTRAKALIQKCNEHMAAHRIACKLREDLAEARRAWKAESRRDQEHNEVQEVIAPKADLVDMFLDLRRVVKSLVSEVETRLRRPEDVKTESQRSHASHATSAEMIHEKEVLKDLTKTLGCSKDELPSHTAALVKKCHEHVAAQHIVAALQKLLYVESVSEVLPALKEVLDVAALRQKVMQRASQTSGQMDLASRGA